MDLWWQEAARAEKARIDAEAQELCVHDHARTTRTSHYERFTMNGTGYILLGALLHSTIPS